MKLTRKFTIAFGIGVLIVQTGFALLRVSRERDLFKRDIVREEQVLGRSLALSVEMVVETRGERAARDLVEQANQRDSHVEIRWVEPAGGVESAPRAPREVLASLWQGERVTVELSGEDAAVYNYTPVLLPDRRVAAIEIADPLRDERAYLRQSVVNAVLSTAALVVLCALMAWLVGSYFIGRPVRALVGQARRIGTGDLSERITLAQRDELGELAAEMNEMCTAIEEARDRVKRETEAKIAAMEQLKHVDRLSTVGTLASGIAHELGTPLNVIGGHAQLIREDPATSGDSLESAVVIAGQAKRMTEIIRRLLDFARRDQSAVGSADVVAVARRAIGMAEPLARKRDVELVFEACDENLRAHISDEELTQVLVNVVINGVQAMPEGGTLTISMAERKAAPPWNPDAARPMVRIEVQDSGEGMPPETAERIFEPFFTTKDVGEGTGLGLSVAYGIVRERQGWIGVQSAPSEGSCFSIYVPVEVS